MFIITKLRYEYMYRKRADIFIFQFGRGSILVDRADIVSSLEEHVQATVAYSDDEMNVHTLPG